VRPCETLDVARCVRSLAVGRVPARDVQARCGFSRDTQATRGSDRAGRERHTRHDTVAAIVGAAIGALHGASALPQRWRHGLIGRTQSGDDGQVFRLVEAAVRCEWAELRRARSGTIVSIAAALACPGLAAQSQPQLATEGGATAPLLPARAPAQLDALAVAVSPRANRAVSFTNHRSAFYYTQTQRQRPSEHAWFRGFNIAGRRVFSDYRLTVGGVALDPASSRSVVVRPDALVRTIRTALSRRCGCTTIANVSVSRYRARQAPFHSRSRVKQCSLARRGRRQYYTVIGDAPTVPAMTVVVMRHADLF